MPINIRFKNPKRPDIIDSTNKISSNSLRTASTQLSTKKKITAVRKTLLKSASNNHIKRKKYIIKKINSSRRNCLYERSNLSNINNFVRKLPGIPRELPRYVDRAIYPEGMLGVLSRKHYIGFPLLSSELDA
jgi:hypothetical protein